MGGDRAPEAILQGCWDAAPLLSGDDVVYLVGDEAVIRKGLEASKLTADQRERYRTVATTEVVAMDDPPVEAIRNKPNSSISVMCKMASKGEADVVISAGNTGACVAAATFLVPRLPHARRGGIAVTMPTRAGHCVLMDVGANIQCKPVHLVQYALMAREYAREVCGIDDPRVALLSVGGEEGKGNPLVKETFAALKAVKGLRFTGNVEGQQIFSGDVDVVVCEGFVGNVILKSVEGMAEAFLHLLFNELGDSLGQTNPAGREVLAHLRTRTDYAQYGGAPLMGHEAAVFISHGRSNATAMKNAVRFANSFVGHSVNARITEALAAVTADAEVAAALEGGA